VHWHKSIASQYATENPHLDVNLWGDPRVVEKVKPRILRGDPPDLLLMSDLPIWHLIAADKLLPFDEYLDQPAFGSAEHWRDLFIPGTLDTYQTGGKTYAIPSAFGAWACWYDARLFREHGWQVPKTWSEFEALCDAIKAAGFAPLAFQGKYPYYGWWSFISVIQRCGGLAAVNRVNAMDPGALTHPDVVQAATLLQRLSTRYFQKGAFAMTHTESQLQFVNNNAAMIFCGLWLYNEMKDSIPPGFEMRCFTVPEVESGKGNPNLFNGSGWEFMFIPTQARFPQEAFAFARYMVSPVNAPGMGKAIGVISPLRNGTPRETVAPPLQSALDMIENAEGIFSIRLDMLLLAWRTQIMEPAMAGLLSGELAPEVFCTILEEGVQNALKDPDLIVPPAHMYDVAAFGESP
jgi:N-acetylglucosamine transport system substrate-binding protein